MQHAPRPSQPPFSIPPPPPPIRVDWRKAWRGLRGLAKNPDETTYVFEIIEALGTRHDETLFREFVADPGGQRLLRERPELFSTIQQLYELAKLPAGSFGRVYAEFMLAAGMTPEGLEQAFEYRKKPADFRYDPARQYFFRRIRHAHDLWHVLSGYGRDEAGEIANLAFSYGQLRDRGMGAIALSGALMGPMSRRFYWQRYVFKAYRRGRNARPIWLLPYEECLARPLEEVRRELRIEPPEVSHAHGLIVSKTKGDLRSALSSVLSEH